MTHLIISSYPVTLVFMAISVCIAITIEAFYELFLVTFV
jgi:hypothetical protein